MISIRRAVGAVCGLATMVAFAGARFITGDGGLQPGNPTTCGWPQRDVARHLTETLRPGDVVFRASRSAVGRAVVAADVARFPYSHVGIAVGVTGLPRIVHAEPGDGGRPAGVVRQTVEDFLALPDITGAAVYRLSPTDPAAALEAASVANRYANQALPFDRDFDLATPDRVYCTELLWKVFEAAGVDLVGGLSSAPRLPLSRRPYLLPGTLLRGGRLVGVSTWLITETP